MRTYCYPYNRGTGWRSQGFRTNPGGVNPPGGHTGYDQAMDAGTPLYAPGDGIIRNSDWVGENYRDNPWWLTRYGGDMIVLDCFGPDGTTASGPTFVLAHLSNSIAPVGKRVRKGELIALSGNTGTATTGPHVHIEALPPGWDWDNGVYGRVDPEKYFTEWPEDIPQGAAAIGTQAGTITTIKEWDDMATPQQIQDAFYNELKSPRSQQLIKDAVFGELGSVRSKGRLRDAVWSGPGGTRNGKLVSLWRDAVDTNTIVRSVLATVQDIAKKSGTNVAALDADAVVDAIAARLDNSAKGGQ